MNKGIIIERAALITKIILDVDGVLTDGRTYINQDGIEAKKFDLKDGFGLVMAKKAGLSLAFITGSVSTIIDHRARQLGIQEVYHSFTEKDVVLRSIMEQQGLDRDVIAYMGDDLYDLPVMRMVGLSGAPADAVDEVKSEVDWISTRKGGEGAVREFVEMILKAKGSWEETCSHFTKI